MSASPGGYFIVTTARAAVAATAPEELPFYSATSTAYLRDPERVLAGRRRSDETLGSGMETAVQLLTPVALAAATAVYCQLADRAGQAATRGVGRVLARLRGRLRGNANALDAAEPVPPGPLTDEQRARVRAVAEERARALGLSEAQVTLLVGAIMDSLAEN